MIRCRSPRSLLLHNGPLRRGGAPRAGLVLLALVARAAALGPAPVELGTAWDFAILERGKQNKLLISWNTGAKWGLCIPNINTSMAARVTPRPLIATSKEGLHVIID